MPMKKLPILTSHRLIAVYWTEICIIEAFFIALNFNKLNIINMNNFIPFLANDSKEVLVNIRRITITLFLILCLPLFVNAQNRDYNNLKTSSILNRVWNTDYKTVNEISDSIFSLLDKDFVRENYSNKGNYYEVAFYPDEFDRGQDVPFLSFSYFKRTINSNKDLGIEGTKVFRLNEIEGVFLDLYVIWEKLCADLNVIPESKETIVNKTIKESNEVFWQNSEKQDCAIQLHNKNYGNPNKWIISYRVYSK